VRDRPRGQFERLAALVQPPWWESAVAVGAVFILGRTPVLFFRQRLTLIFGGGAGPRWTNDLILQSVWALAEIVVIVVAIRHAKPSALLRQRVLLVFLVFAWLSIAWSIDPGVSLRRVLLFIGAAGVGWYIGERFLPSQQATIAAAAAAVGAVVSLLAVLVWRDLATKTITTRADFNRDLWSGIYVNRNLLAIVMSFGLLAAIVLFPTSRRRIWLVALACPLVYFLVLSQARTAPIALGVATATTLAVYLLRRFGGKALTARGGATITLLTLGTVGFMVHIYWSDILGYLGRDQTLTGRTAIWQVNRWLSSARPWQGWGFEAIWTDPTVIQQSQRATGRYPFSAHNGYYEILLSLGRVGLVLFVLFLASAAWRAFRYAWPRRDLASLWFLAIIVFAVVVNFSESMFVSAEALWVLTVAASVGATEYGFRRPT
jgi:exopolysaccharide production protein ExoQ